MLKKAVLVLSTLAMLVSVPTTAASALTPASDAEGANGNYLVSVDPTAHLVSAGLGVRAKITYRCSRTNDFGYTFVEERIGQVLDEKAQYAFNYRNDGEGTLICDDLAHTVNMTAWVGQGQRVFKPGKASALFNMTGYNAKGILFKYSINRIVSVKA